MLKRPMAPDQAVSHFEQRTEPSWLVAAACHADTSGHGICVAKSAPARLMARTTAWPKPGPDSIGCILSAQALAGASHAAADPLDPPRDACCVIALSRRAHPQNLVRVVYAGHSWVRM